MNSLAVLFLGLVCCSVAMAGYSRSYYHSGHKTHLGGYGYRPIRYAVHAKPVVHHAPVVYAHKSYSKPHVTHYVKPHVAHYVKPTYHHPEPHGVVYSKPAYYLGGHSHGLSYKPSHSHGYVHRPVVYAPHKPYHY